MKKTILARVFGILALIGTIAPSVFFMQGQLSEGAMKIIMLIATVIWFICAPLLMPSREQ